LYAETFKRVLGIIRTKKRHLKTENKGKSLEVSVANRLEIERLRNNFHSSRTEFNIFLKAYPNVGN